jgi:hypothetical protein
MKKTTLAAAVAAASMGLGQVVVADDFKEALTGGEVNFDFRYRYENVDDDNSLTDDAHASTLRSRLTYTTKTWNDFQAQVEVDDVSIIGSMNHCDGTDAGFCAGAKQHSVVLDPEDSEINQAWIAYTGLDNTTIKYGNQRVNLDNQRFIGGVAWRQNEQTHDALAIVNSSLPDTTIVFAAVDTVNHITGTNYDTDTFLLNVNYSGLSFGTLSAYGYQIDVLGTAIAGVSNDTYGVRLAGMPEMDGWKLVYELEWATQSEHESSKQTAYDADYHHVVLGAQVAGITAKVGQELQESDGGVTAFKTPLGTNHKFGGWADQFLATPVEGLEDTYVAVSGNVLGAKVVVSYHEFEPDVGPGDLGDEIDIAISKKVADNATVLLKYAHPILCGGFYRRFFFAEIILNNAQQIES